MATPGTWLARWRRAAQHLKTETLALYFSIRDPRTPWYARLAGALVVAYAISPLDLIPDFVPVLGYLDDLILVPLGLWLTLKLIPPQVMADSRARAAESEQRPVSWAGAAVIILVWLAAIVLTSVAMIRLFHLHPAPQNAGRVNAGRGNDLPPLKFAGVRRGL
jgi:uncharacterized membrane protein YkvA (DUF1232 family)